MTRLKNKNPAKFKVRPVPKPPFTQKEFQKILRVCRTLPPAEGQYRVEDYVVNVLVTVLDFRMHAGVLNKALEYFRRTAAPKIRTHRELKKWTARFADHQAGNTALAESLWGYKYWTRAALLRKLIFFFDKQGVQDQESLKTWALGSHYERDFKGRVPGLGYAVYQWLVMRLGVSSIKPDTHVKRFLKALAGRDFTDKEAVEILCHAAKVMKLDAAELDWRVWEYARRVAGKRNAVKFLGEKSEAKRS